MTSLLTKTARALVAGLLLLGTGCAAASPPAASAARAGSQARFIVRGDVLYALDNFQLHIYRAAEAPDLIDTVPLDMQAETIFPYGDLLFLGTRQGMLVYDASEPQSPRLLGMAGHLYACDPVVVSADIAYVTLHASSQCRGGEDVLIIYDANDPTAPTEIASLEMASPRGLAVFQDQALYVADHEAGLVVVDIRDPSDPEVLEGPKLAHGAGAYEVIVDDDRLFLVTRDGLYQHQVLADGTVVDVALSHIHIGKQQRIIVDEPLRQHPADAPAPTQQYATPPIGAAP